MEILNNKSTICDIIANYMEGKKDAVASLKEIYPIVKDKWKELKSSKVPADETIRAAIYRAPKKYNFERIGKGLYFLKGDNTASFLIQGDGRNLTEIDDNSIDCIITDHPWEDKKAHRSGNHKAFADYETFKYEKSDFEAKARVLKEGSYLAEFLPIESATNWRYLNSIKEMAEEVGFKYYCQLIWRNAKEGEINTGRTTKGVQQILIFSKGKARRLSPKGKPYATKNMLSYETYIPANKGKEKMHQAEKPIPVYEYLIENLTEEQDVCLDQFGGSCNLAKAAVNKNRWAIVYEKSADFAKKAAQRFDMIKLNSPLEIQPENQEKINDGKENKEQIVIKVIPKESTDFQYKHLMNCLKYKRSLFSAEEENFINGLNKNNLYSYAENIDNLFNKINQKGYQNYKRVSNVTLTELEVLNPMYEKIEKDFEAKFSGYTRSFYINYKLEMEMFIEFAVLELGVKEYDKIIKNNLVFNKYIQYLKDKKIDYTRTVKVLGKYFISNGKVSA